MPTRLFTTTLSEILVTSSMVPPWQGGVATGPMLAGSPGSSFIPPPPISKSPHSRLVSPTWRRPVAAAPRSRIWRKSPLPLNRPVVAAGDPEDRTVTPLINSSCRAPIRVSHHALLYNPKPQSGGGRCEHPFWGQTRPPQLWFRPRLGVFFHFIVSQNPRGEVYAMQHHRHHHFNYTSTRQTAGHSCPRAYQQTRLPRPALAWRIPARSHIGWRPP
jgi:hypothetical protein